MSRLVWVELEEAGISNQSRVSKKIKFLTVLLISILMVLASFQVEASPPKPSTPTFNVKFYNVSYDVPPIYTTDPYTGKSVVQYSGVHVNYTMIAFLIDNQPFTPYWDENGNYVNIYYEIRFKGHFGSTWNNYTRLLDGYTSKMYPLASSSEQTVLLGNGTEGLTSFKDGDQVDFQVAAKIGYEIPKPYFTPMGSGFTYQFIGESSDFSNSQTITIGDPAFLTDPLAATSPAPQPTPLPTASPIETPTPTSSPSGQIPTTTVTPLHTEPPNQSTIQNNNPLSFDWDKTTIVLLVVLLCIAFLAIMVLWRKISKIGNKTEQ